MPVYQLPEEPVFPPAEEAGEDGLIAVGGDFSPERLLQAYAGGIFPWFENEREIYWFSPEPRLVLFPCDLKISRSLDRILKSNRFEVKFDTMFTDVVRNCADVRRKDQPGTWISERFVEGYTRLHDMGFAHSAEVFAEGRLAGGLYGVSLGAAFFGESMFSRESNASKVALYHLTRKIATWQFHFIDCQVATTHLLNMGATLISRREYLERLSAALCHPTIRVFS